MIKGKNLKYIRGNHWVNPEEFAELMGIPLEILQDWEDGKRLLSDGDLIKLAQRMKVTPEKLLERLSKEDDFYPWGDFSDVPLAPDDLLLSVRGGTILDFTGLECQILRFPSLTLGFRPETTFLYQLKADNMAPRHKKGACCVFEPPFGGLKDFDIALMRIDDLLTVRRLYQIPGGGWELRCSNGLYPPIILGVEGSQILEFCLGRLLLYDEVPTDISKLPKKVIQDRKRPFAI